jgi:hypothetical protein
MPPASSGYAPASRQRQMQRLIHEANNNLTPLVGLLSVLAETPPETLPPIVREFLPQTWDRLLRARAQLVELAQLIGDEAGAGKQEQAGAVAPAEAITRPPSAGALATPRSSPLVVKCCRFRALPAPQDATAALSVTGRVICGRGRCSVPRPAVARWGAFSVHHVAWLKPIRHRRGGHATGSASSAAVSHSQPHS